VDRQRHARLENLFHRALEHEPADRAAFLDRECADDPALRAEVEALLAEDATPDEIIEPTIVSVMPDDVPESIGPYRILEKIGEGGFAVVYSAWQNEPVRRRVAVKVLKPGLDSKAVLARFEAERQTVALMDHPSIARVYDAGQTEQGRPYFVMELVEGMDLVSYADHHKLDLRERIELMVTVCRAVQHAHQKGVIHRDLKPSNVLVTRVDDRPLPKVIDFGIAKAVSPDLHGTLVFTTHGQFIGTPEYCSPEQADPGNLDIDTRADVYSLGVLAYELLTGELPFSRETLRRAGLAEVLRILREDAPPPPSTRVQTSVLDDPARMRGTDRRTLTRRLRGDLDWIILKALEKERERRYETANGLAADLQRFLRGDAVEAGPPSLAYRAGKTLRRHRAAFTAAGASVVVLIAFVVVLFVQNQRVSAARDDAERQARTAERTTAFLAGLFEYSDPGRARGNDITARELLDLGADKIATELEDEPLVKASLLVTMGQVYRRIEQEDRAIDYLEEAVRIRERELGAHALPTVGARFSLTNGYMADGRYEQALQLLPGVVDDYVQLLGTGDPTVQRARHTLANAYLMTGRPDEAIAMYRIVWDARRRTLGSEHHDTLYAQFAVANAYVQTGQDDEAEPLMRDALARLRTVRGSDHPNVIMILGEMGELDYRAGSIDSAIALFEEAAAGYAKILGENSARATEARERLARARAGLPLE
jgi:eukaryotic-like serine/threonine-protein kinase